MSCPYCWYNYHYACRKSGKDVNEDIYNKYAPKEETSTEPKNVYVCSVCGFEYEGELDSEPADYKCPICGCAKGVFKKQG